MLTSLAFFLGYTKDRLSYSLPETLGCQRCEGQGAEYHFLLTPWTHTVGRQHSCLVAAACEFLVLTFKTIRKYFLLFFLLSPLLVSPLLSPSLPPSSSLPPLSFLGSPSHHPRDLPAYEASPSSGASSHESSWPRKALYICLVRVHLCRLSEVTHSVSEGVSGSQVGTGPTASLAELPSWEEHFCLREGLTHGFFRLKKLILKNRAQPKAIGNGDGETRVLRKSLQ